MNETVEVRRERQAADGLLRVLRTSWARVRTGEASRLDFRRLFKVFGRLDTLDQLTLLESFHEFDPLTYQIVAEQVSGDVRSVSI